MLNIMLNMKKLCCIMDVVRIFGVKISILVNPLVVCRYCVHKYQYN
jgi:hypothetical protein